MEDKLQQLTQKLYEEGLSKGRSEAEGLIAKAKADAETIIKDAQARAEAIIKTAKDKAEDVRNNTRTEIMLASKQMLSALKQQIEKLIVEKNVSPAINKVMVDPANVKDIIIAFVKNWSDSGRGDVKVIIPEDIRATFRKELHDAMASVLGGGFEIVMDKGLKSGFRVGPKDGGYYISFSDEDFDKLFRGYLRPKVGELLYSDSEK